jgi:hypothetical protein
MKIHVGDAVSGVPAPEPAMESVRGSNLTVVN